MKKGLFLSLLIGAVISFIIAAKPYLSDNIETTASLSTFTPVEGQIVVDKTKDTLVVGDGSTTGGIPLARQDLSNAVLTASKAAVTNSSGVLTTATTTATEIGYVNGVTSAIQTQIDSKEPTINNAAFYVDNTNLNVAVQDTTPNYNFSVSQATTGIGTISNAALANEVQSITPDLVPDTGTYTISYDSKTTAEIAFDGNTDAIQSALDTATLTDVTAAGSMLTAITLTYSGAYAGADLDLATVVDTMTSTDTPVICTVAQVTAGNPGTDVTGVGTQFLNTFKVGDSITAGGQTKAITAIASNTAMTTAAFTVANVAAAYTLTGGERFKVYGNGNTNIPGLTASKVVVTDANKNLASATQTGIGTTVVMSTSPTIDTPVITTSATLPLIKPASDSTTAVQIGKADGTTPVVIFDTTNSRVGIGTTPLYVLDITRSINDYIMQLKNTKSDGYGFTLQAGGVGTTKEAFLVRNSNASATMLSLLGNGNVLINSVGIGNVGFGGVTNPTARVHLPASTAAANTASMKIDEGTVADTPVSGNFESDGTHLYWTDSSGTRLQLDNAP